MEEKALLTFLIDKRFATSGDVMRQLEGVRVLAEEPDTGSLALTVVPGTSEAGHASAVPVEAVGADSDGVPVHVLLHMRQGFINELDIYREDLRPVISKPTPGTLSIESAPG